MSLGQMDAKHREQQGPPDLLAYVEKIISDHVPYPRGDGWGPDGGDSWACEACDARLDEAEATTHIAHQLWIRGVLHT